MRGHHSVSYHTAAQAHEASGDISASLSRAGVKGSVSGEFSTEVSSTRGARSQVFDYEVIGWGGKYPPSGSSMEELLDSANYFEMTTGRRMEAVLGSYEDIQDYREGLKAFQDAGGTDAYTPLNVRFLLHCQ